MGILYNHTLNQFPANVSEIPPRAPTAMIPAKKIAPISFNVNWLMGVDLKSPVTQRIKKNARAKIRKAVMIFPTTFER